MASRFGRRRASWLVRCLSRCSATRRSPRRSDASRIRSAIMSRIESDLGIVSSGLGVVFMQVE